jgi:multidrug efflux pump subunit AcrB
MNKTWLTVIVKRPFVWWACAVVILTAAVIGYVVWQVESEPAAEPQVAQAAIDKPGPARQPASNSKPQIKRSRPLRRPV